jgi:type III secretion system YscQ/HrcQ family protein
MSVATRRSGGLQLTSKSTHTRVTPAELAGVCDHSLTNPLYQSRGVKVHDFTWYWQDVRPTRIREWVTLTAGDSRIQIAFDGEVIGLATEPHDWHQYAGDVRLLAWVAYHEPILELLNGVFQRQWLPESLDDCDPSAHAQDIQSGFSVYSSSGMCVANGVALFDRDCIAALTSPINAREPRQHGGAHVPAVLTAIIDEFELPATELAALHRDSVVRLDNRTLRTTPRVLIALGTLLGIAEIHGTRATLVGFAAASSCANDPTPGANTMNDIETSTLAPSDTTTSGRAIDPRSLPVKLRFTVGRICVPFGVLADAAPGFVFELDKPLDDQTITIHANDVPIAQGELVTLGDLLGVRISRMLPQP